MENHVRRRRGREDWILAALDLLIIAGIEGVKVVPLAERLGVTSGSFYWHFKNRQELHDVLLVYWEKEMTDSVIELVKTFEGPPEERIWFLMDQVMSTGLARFDLAVWHWAQTNPIAEEAFRRVLNRRFAFARWMFEQAGFDRAQAESRGRMMVVYMMGESTLIPGAPRKHGNLLRLNYDILIGA